MSDQQNSKKQSGLFNSLQQLYLLGCKRLRAQQGVVVIASLLLIYFGLIAQVSIWFMLSAIVIVAGAAAWFYQELDDEEKNRLFKRGKARHASALSAGSSIKRTAASARALINAIDAPIFILNSQSQIMHFNEIAELVFSHVDLGDSFNLKFRSPELLRAISTAITTETNQKLEYQTSNPSEAWYMVEIAPIPGYLTQTQLVEKKAEGDKGFLIVFRDITHAHAVERMRSDFIANASHELRTPLASVSGYIDTLLGAAKNDEKAREQFLQIMQKDAARMSRLIDDLLSLSKIEMQRNMVYQEQVDLDQVLTQVIGTLTPVAKSFDVTINYENSATDCMVLGEYDALVQVFQNLIENACKYGQNSDASNQVDVQLIKFEASPDNPKEGYVEVSVRDYGAGIEEHHLPRLTERFYRVSVEASRAHKGTGLGLAIVKHILNQHRADLNITSKIGDGSRFAVRFMAK